ncbi:MAG: prepilin peptidase [bacterium]|nr:prepilin peptidase [bacterium]
MSLFFSIFIFLFGLIIGSFLNCVIYRLALPSNSERGLKNRSYCPHCKHLLSWQDLIPVFSFIFLKGKCRYCQKPISLQYPIVEISTGLMFLLIFNQFSIGEENFVLFFTFASTVEREFHSLSYLHFLRELGNGSSVFNFLNLIYYWTIASFLIVIFVYDLKHYIIPDKVIYPAIAIALIFNFQFSIGEEGSALFFTFAPINGSSVFNYSILSAILAAAFFLSIVLISRGKWMGVGDIKLAFFMGLVLGWPNILLALFLAFFIGATVGVGLIISNKKTLKSEIPFGPFLVTGTFLVLFWGNELISWYQGLFLVK